MRDSQSFPDAETQTHWQTGVVLKVAVSSLLVLVAMSLGWLGIHLFPASVV